MKARARTLLGLGLLWAACGAPAPSGLAPPAPAPGNAGTDGGARPTTPSTPPDAGPLSGSDAGRADGGTADGGTADGGGAADGGLGGRAIQTVFLIVLENHDWAEFRNNPSAPYLNGTLLPQASRAEQYFNPPNNHPSLPNYLWLESGQNFGIQDDNDPAQDAQSTTAHLVTRLDALGVPWRSYQEQGGGTSCPLTDNPSGQYAIRHNPFSYFNDVTGNQDPRSAYCIAHIRPYGELAGDLKGHTTARYNFIVPDTCHDGHDTCPPLNDPVKQTDQWLAAQVPPLLASQAFLQGGALFITWDESENSDGPIGLIVLSPAAKGHGYSNSVHYTHSSLLRTVEEVFGVTPLLGDSSHATSLSDLFTRYP